MDSTRHLMVAASLFIAACGGNGSTSPDLAGGPNTDMMPVIVGMHGFFVDYFTGTPLPGLTVTDVDSNEATTSDAQGNWTLSAPLGVKLERLVTGPKYGHLYLSEVIPTGVDVDIGQVPIGDTQAVGLEVNITGADPTLAVVQVTVHRTGACTSLVGATLNVTSPPGAGVAYMNAQRLPVGSSMIDAEGNHPQAAIFNLTPGADISVELVHPTCKLSAKSTSFLGAARTGTVKTVAYSPGDWNSSLALLAE